MIALASKVNVDAPSSAYPYGNVRNNPGDSSGTPVDVSLVGDAMQFFEALMANVGYSANGQPESATYGFQLMAALAQFCKNIVTLFIASQTQVNNGTDANSFVTSSFVMPSRLKAYLDTTVISTLTDPVVTSIAKLYSAYRSITFSTSNVTAGAGTLPAVSGSAKVKIWPDKTFIANGTLNMTTSGVTSHVHIDFGAITGMTNFVSTGATIVYVNDSNYQLVATPNGTNIFLIELDGTGIVDGTYILLFQFHGIIT